MEVGNRKFIYNEKKAKQRLFFIDPQGQKGNGIS
jgi:hypothetical protein